VGLGNVDNTSDASKPVSTAQQTALDLKANLATPTFTGTVTASNDLVVDGNLTVNGTTFNASSTSITIEDNMVQLAHQNAANTVDLGLVVGYNDGSAKHAGIVRDVSDNKWKLFNGVTTEPTTTVNFGQGSLDALAVGAFEASSATIGDVSNTELQYVNGVTSSIQTQLNDKASLASPTFTGTVAGITKTMVGLGSVDNTADTAKPVSTAQQTALDLKANLTSPTLVTPVLGVATATSINGTTIPSTKTLVVTTDKLNVHAATTSAELAGIISDETGSGALVFGTSPTISSPTITGTTTIDAIADASTTTASRGAGYMGVPPSAAATTGAYTIVAADAGEHIYSTATRTITIPANGSVAFPIGTAITFIAATGTTVTIAITTDTLLLAGTGATGNRTLAPFGMATAIKITSTSWIISGNGLT
jgi:hypothetical protein